MATQTQTNVIPSVSSGTAGPCGAIHLPRLWLKLTLGAAGLLPADYDLCGPGFDQMTLNSFNLDRQKTIDYVAQEKPTYLQFEEWVIAQNGGKIDPETVRKHNEAVRAYNHSDELGEKMRSASGVKDSTIKDAVTLNMLEDLDEIYHRVTGK